MENIIKAFLDNNIKEANRISKERYPFKLIKKEKRTISKKDMLAVFLKDWFIDRYSWEKLYNPWFLRMLSSLLPESFPFQQHWKAEECHDIFWSKMPSIDHLNSIYSGWENNFSNWITTSMRRNLAKNNSTLEEIWWNLRNPWNLSEWDWHSKNFIEIYERFEDELKQNNYIRSWYSITKKALNY